MRRGKFWLGDSGQCVLYLFEAVRYDAPMVYSGGRVDLTTPAVDDSDRGPDRAFADLVLDLLKEAKIGKSSASGRPPGVRKVVYGLAFLDQITRDYIKNNAFYDNLAVGAFEALEIIEALNTGVQHPIFNFVGGVRSNQRLNRPPAGFRIRLSRAAAVGAVDAYLALKQCNKSEARRAVAACLNSSNNPVTEADLKNWKNRLAESDCLPFANQILKESAGNPDFALERGSAYFAKCTGTPD